MARKQLTGLSSELYEHPFDRKALASLQKMPGISLLFRKINEYGIDRLLRLQCKGCDIRVTPHNFPELHETLVEACRILDMALLPELYLFRGNGFIQAHTIGVEQPIVAINLEAMEWLSPDELLYVIGKEVGHIKSRHLLYHQTAIMLPALKTLISNSTLGIGGLATSGVELALYNWLIMAKFTADRAGLLACQDISVATTALIKIAGLPSDYLTPTVIEDFITQAREFEANNLDNFDKLTQMLSFTQHQHAWAVMRASELLKWADSGGYENLVQGKKTGDRPPPEKTESPEIKEETQEKEAEKEAEDWDFLTSWESP
jgi:hypothetical protein